jgi:hypothetical protein
LLIISVNKYLTKNLRKKRHILLMVSEVSVHHGGEDIAEQLTSLHTGRRANRNGPGQDITPKNMLPVIYFFQPGLTFHSSTNSQ